MHWKPKTTMRVIALAALLVALGACAKYPVVMRAQAPSPSAANPAAATSPDR